MKKFARSILAVFTLVVMCALPAVTALAETDPETGKDVYSDLPAIKYIKDDGSLTIIDFYGGNTYKKIVIPNAIGDPISEIRDEAFLGADPEKVEAVYLPDTLMKLGKNAFWEGMKVIVYPSGDYRKFATAADGQTSNRLLKDPEVSALTVLSETSYGAVLVNDGVHYRMDGIIATVVGYSGSEKELHIASEAGGLPVTTIESGALKDANLEKLYLPSSVTTVEEDAVGPFEVIFRADTDAPIVPSETPVPTESIAPSVETGTADIGTFDMSLEEFVTTASPETKEAATEAEESGSEDETEEESGEESREPVSIDPVVVTEENAAETDDSTAASNEEPADSKDGPSPWLYVGIGIGAVVLAGGTVVVVQEMEKRKRRKSRGK